MVFGIISRTKTCSAINEASKCVSGTGTISSAQYHRGATANERAARENAKISSAQIKNALEYLLAAAYP